MLSLVAKNEKLHPVAVEWDTAAELYEQGRPDYPLELLEHVKTLCEFGETTSIVDLAAGTGKLSRLLVNTGCAVTAVEPSREMRAALSRELPTVTVKGGSAEAIPLDDNSVDVLAVGEAFHWFDGPRAWQELVRIVRPGGLVVAAWLHRNVTDWQQQLLAYLRPYAQAVPNADVDDVDGNRSLQGFPRNEFAPIKPWSIVYEQPYTMSRLRQMYESYSFISLLKTRERNKVLDEIEELVRREAGVEQDEIFSLPLQLATWSTVRLKSRLA